MRKSRSAARNILPALRRFFARSFKARKTRSSARATFQGQHRFIGPHYRRQLYDGDTALFDPGISPGHSPAYLCFGEHVCRDRRLAYTDADQDSKTKKAVQKENAPGGSGNRSGRHPACFRYPYNLEASGSCRYDERGPAKRYREHDETSPPKDPTLIKQATKRHGSTRTGFFFAMFCVNRGFLLRFGLYFILNS
jgi:hypothetical protein